MAYSALAIANAFIERAQEGKLKDLTPMKLQKLMFYAQSWYLKFYEKPLLDDAFCRWQYGPVIPSIYHEFRRYRASPITERGSNAEVEGDKVRIVTPYVPEEDSETWKHIEKIIAAYGHLSGSELSSLTHEPGGAWEKKGSDGKPIPPDGGPITNKELIKGLSPKRS